jgi:hypothetical protein
MPVVTPQQKGLVTQFTKTTLADKNEAQKVGGRYTCVGESLTLGIVASEIQLEPQQCDS